MSNEMHEAATATASPETPAQQSAERGHETALTAYSTSRELRSVNETVTGILATLDIKPTDQAHQDGALSGPVSAMCLSFDGTRLITASGHRAKLWDVDAERALVSFSSGGTINSVFLSRDGKSVVLGGERTMLCDASTGRCLGTFGEHDAEFPVFISDDGKRLLTVKSGEPQLYDTADGKLVRKFAQCDGCYLTPDGTRLISLESFTRVAKVFDADTGECLDTFSYDEIRLVWPFLTDDGQPLGLGEVGVQTQTMKLYDLRRGRSLLTIEGAQELFSWDSPFRFSADGTRLVVNGRDGFQVWDVAAYRLLGTFRGKNAVISGNGRRLAVTDWEPAVTVHELDAPAEITQRHPFSLAPTIPPAFCQITAVDDPEDLEATVGQASSLAGKLEAYPTSSVPSPRRLAMASKDGDVRFLDLETGRWEGRFRAPPAIVYDVCLSGDGRRLAVKHGFWPRLTVEVWDTVSGQSVWSEAIAKGVIHRLVLNHNGNRLALDRGDTIAVVDTPARRYAGVYEGGLHPFALSGDGNRIVTKQDNTLTAWDIDANQPTQVCDQPRPGGHILALDLDMHGERLAVTTQRSVELWDVPSAAVLATFDYATFCFVDAAGTRVVVDSRCPQTKECTVTVASLASGKAVTRFQTPETVGKAVFLARNLKLLITQRDEHEYCFWDPSGCREPRAVFHHIDHGFLWTAPPDSGATSGRLFTDRLDLIHVIARDLDGSNPRAVPDGDKERDYHIDNRWPPIRDRLFDPRKYIREVTPVPPAPLVSTAAATQRRITHQESNP